MLARILGYRMRRNRLLLLFLLLVVVGIWLLHDSESWILSVCWTKNCKKIHYRLHHNTVLDDDHSFERAENLLISPISENIKNMSTICKLPKLDPFEPSIRHLIKDFGDDPNCQGQDLHFNINSKGNLVLKNKDYRSILKLRSAKVTYIVRPEDNDDSYYIGPEMFPFKKAANKKVRKMTTDFVKITYETKDSDEEIIQHIARVSPKKEVLERSQKALTNNPNNLPLNILMFGFDSTSNAMFRRKLPKTADYLKNQLDAYILNGYTVVGDGTTPILTALLTGKFVSELAGNKEKRLADDLNRWPWIMKDYAKHGYATLYAEDDQKIAAFNIRMKGFRSPPADHYMRPFWLALEDYKLRKLKRQKKFPENNLGCLDSEPLYNITLDYLFSMHDAYPKTPKFGFAFMSYLSHGIPDKLSYADNDLIQYLKKYEKIQNNTVLIILSDHGARIGPLRNSMQGSLEERLPWFSIVLPKWFRKQYPDLAANLKNNQDVVTSPFDVHATLQHLLMFPRMNRKHKTQSLLTSISQTRTCSQAGIDYHYCPCVKWKPISVNVPEVKAAAKAIIRKINDNIAKNDYTAERCAPVVLTLIIYAAEVDMVTTISSPVRNGRVRVRQSKIPHGRQLQVVIETSPLKGTFEATATVGRNGGVTINQHISRTSAYSNNPHCVVDKHPELRKFCVCYDRIENNHNG